MPSEETSRHLTPPAPRWIALIGPPAVGKNSLAKALTEPLGARVFNLRAFARARNAPPLPAEVALDPRGEYTDAVIDDLIRAALLYDRFPTAGRPVILPDFPTTVAGLTLLHSVAQLRGVPLMVLELDAINGELMARAYHRRLCLACLPDLNGHPHAPASPDPGMPTRCDTCSGPLAVRRADQPNVFLARLTRYREQRSTVRAAADAARIPWAQVYATNAAADLSMALRLLAASTTAVLASRDRGPVDGIPRPRTATSNHPDLP